MIESISSQEPSPLQAPHANALPMKTNSSERARKLAIGSILTLVATWSLFSAAAAKSQDDLTTRITHSHVFYQPLACVGPAAPSDAENEILWGAIQQMEKGAMEQSIQILERFVAS